MMYCKKCKNEESECVCRDKTQRINKIRMIKILIWVGVIIFIFITSYMYLAILTGIEVQMQKGRDRIKDCENTCELKGEKYVTSQFKDLNDLKIIHCVCMDNKFLEREYVIQATNKQTTLMNQIMGIKG